MTRNIRLLYLHNFLMDFRIQAVFMVIYFNQIAGSYTAAMGIIAAQSLTSAVLDIPTGILSDKIGRRITIILGSCLATAAAICYASAHSTALLYVGAFLSGLGGCLFSGNNNALMYETLQAKGMESEFPHYQGRAGSMFQLALGSSALIGSLFAPPDMRLIFMLGIIPAAVSILVSLFLSEARGQAPHEHKDFAHFITACRTIRRNPRLRALMFGLALSRGAGESQFHLSTPFINNLWPFWALGLYRGACHALCFLSFWKAGAILKRIKPFPTLVFAESFWFIGETLALIMANVVSPVIKILETLPVGPFLVGIEHLMQEDFTDAQRATMGSVASFLGSLFIAIISLIIGNVADHFSLIAGLAVCIGVRLLALPTYIWLFRKHI